MIRLYFITGVYHNCKNPPCFQFYYCKEYVLNILEAKSRWISMTLSSEHIPRSGITVLKEIQCLKVQSIVIIMSVVYCVFLMCMHHSKSLEQLRIYLNLTVVHWGGYYYNSHFSQWKKLRHREIYSNLPQTSQLVTDRT